MDSGVWQQRRASEAPFDQNGWSVTFSFLPGFDLSGPATHVALLGNGLAAWPTAPRLEESRERWFVAPDQEARQEICQDVQLKA